MGARGSKRVDQIITHLEQHGFVCERGRHVKVRAPDGSLVTTIPVSGKHKGVDRWVYVRGYLRRAGYEIPDL